LAHVQPHSTSYLKVSQHIDHFIPLTLACSARYMVNLYRSSGLGKPTSLVSIDLSSAFDRVDHNISLLLGRLYTSFDIIWRCFFLATLVHVLDRSFSSTATAFLSESQTSAALIVSYSTFYNHQPLLFYLSHKPQLLS